MSHLMKNLLLILVLISGLANAQSKKKIRKAEEKAAMELQANLKTHVQFLADDKLEGRRAGSPGEKLALEYIIDQYKAIGIEPKGNEGFDQVFEINEGKQIDPTTKFLVNGKELVITTEYFPLTYGAQKTVKGSPAMALNERGQPWFRDLKEVLEEKKPILILISMNLSKRKRLRSHPKEPPVFFCTIVHHSPIM